MSNMTSERYTVRKQSSGYTASVTWYVYDNVRKGRVTVNPFRSREAAQADADSLNISAMVKDYADDPRPYAERRTEAEQVFHAKAEPQKSGPCPGSGGRGLDGRFPGDSDRCPICTRDFVRVTQASTLTAHTYPRSGKTRREAQR